MEPETNPDVAPPSETPNLFLMMLGGFFASSMLGAALLVGGDRYLDGGLTGTYDRAVTDDPGLIPSDPGD